MRAFNKPATALKNHFFIVFVFLFLLNFPFFNGECSKNVLSNDASYLSFTNALINKSLQDCQNKVVWLDGIELQSAPLIYSFYSKNHFNPVWTDGNELTKQAEAIINLLKDSYKYGFEPANFDIVAIEHFSHLLSKEKQVKKTAKMRVRFEFLMTNSIFTFMSQITRGTEYTYTKDIFINGDSIILSFPGYLNDMLSSSNIKEDILKLQPNDSEYITLQHEIEEIVLNMVTSDNTVEVPDIKEDSASYFNLFSYIFTRNGIIKNEIRLSNPQVFSSMLTEFQKIIGIRTSGKIDNATLRSFMYLQLHLLAIH